MTETMNTERSRLINRQRNRNATHHRTMTSKKRVLALISTAVAALGISSSPTAAVVQAMDLSKVHVCHNGKTFTVKRENLKKRRDSGDTIGKCSVSSNGQDVTICHVGKRRTRERTMTQSRAYYHLLNHPNDFFSYMGPCIDRQTRTEPPRTTRPTQPTGKIDLDWVDVCHKGRTYTVKRSNLPTRQRAGNFIGKCSVSKNGQDVRICHRGERRTGYKTLSQADAWFHMINHPDDFLGYLGACTAKEEPTPAPGAKLKGTDFTSNGDLNDLRLLEATLPRQFVLSNTNAHVTWYGTRFYDFEIDTIEYATVERNGNYYLTYVDTFGRPNLFLNSKDFLSMRIGYGRSTSSMREIDIEMDGSAWTVDIDLDDILRPGRLRRGRRDRRDLSEVLSQQQDSGERREATGQEHRSNNDLLRKSESMHEEPIEYLRRASRLSKQDMTLTGQQQSQSQQESQNHRRLSQTSRLVRTSLTGCGDRSYDDAVIMMEYTVRDNVRQRERTGTVAGTNIEGTRVASGRYEFMIPVDKEMDQQLLIDACNPAVISIEETCQTFDDELYLMNEADREDLTDLIVSRVEFTLQELDDNIDVLLADAILNSLEAAWESCGIIENRDQNSRDEVDLTEEVCDKLTEEVNFNGNRMFLKPVIVYPFSFVGDDIAERRADVPGARETYEFPSIDVGEQPTIVSFVADPASPRENESYDVTATVSCVNQDRGDQVKITYKGSDGYGGTKICNIPDTGTDECTYEIYAAPAGVVDTVTVTISPHGVTRSMDVEHVRR